MAGYAAAFADALAALELTQVDVFGFHTGALLAIELALACPEIVGRVALSGSRCGGSCSATAKLPP